MKQQQLKSKSPPGNAGFLDYIRSRWIPPNTPRELSTKELGQQAREIVRQEVNKASQHRKRQTE